MSSRATEGNNPWLKNHIEKGTNAWMKLCLAAQRPVQIKQVQLVSQVSPCSAASSGCAGDGNSHPTKKPTEESKMLPSQGMQRGQEERGEARAVGQVGTRDPTGMGRERAVPGAGSVHPRQAAGGCPRLVARTLPSPGCAPHSCWSTAWAASPGDQHLLFELVGPL